MLVKKLRLTNFRNYKSQEVVFSPDRNIIIGDNAQGKTNLLEAIEYVTCGKSYRTSSDGELILSGSAGAILEVEYTLGNYDEKVTILIKPKAATSRAGSGSRIATEKQIKINGVAKGNSRSLRGHLVTVSFTSRDLDLLRGGPVHRRDWIDSLAGTLKRTFESSLSRYHKTVTQRNRLLKQLFEKSGRVSVSDQDQLKVWDQQVAALGALVIKQRVETLNLALPLAEKYQERMSGSSEKLTAEYFFYISSSEYAYGSAYEDDEVPATPRGISYTELLAMDEREIASRLMNLFRLRRRDEIARRQTLSGPHRDDVRFALNGACATAYASQGQQRSLVLSLKLAELELTREHLGEPPVLLLDDVMAELDLNRQGFLVASVESGMQTMITTTHTTGFKKEWLEGATYISVADGSATVLSASPVGN